MAADAGSRLRGLWRRAGSVRVRTTATAVVVVTVALVAAAVALVGLLRAELTDDIRASAELRARDVVLALEDGSAPTVIPVDDEDDLFIQAVDEDGAVVVASDNVAGLPPQVTLEPGRSATVRDLAFEDDVFLVVAEEASTPNGRAVVYVGRESDSVGATTGLVAGVLSLAVPGLALVVGAVTWRVVGRALRPVESMRSEVEEITASELHRRVPEPAGRDEIARLATTLNDMLERLEAGHRRQRRFVSDASHELRSPVASIRQAAEVAATHPEATDLDALAESVHADALRLEALVDDLLVLARADERRSRTRSEAVDLDDLVMAEARRGTNGTDVRVDAGAVSAGRVAGEADQLSRLVRNLLDNARRHARSIVTVSLREVGDSVVLAVDDDGPGVPLAERERVFERFVRLDDARTRDEGGSGLGLAIVAAVAATHGGTVAIEGAPAGGARFVVTLPRYDG